ncbi:WD-40 repeat-containing protein MSI1-like [Rosa rugosa]|uniref:WD-40 repeat-containing protein MSI1-like n=1 Tax=Rosa rugosa TaxID=74645 RepID=UPI002B40825F|nr:WD-40 repeat-containing protein MSI1-like [Rosa rugosa]
MAIKLTPEKAINLTNVDVSTLTSTLNLQIWEEVFQVGWNPKNETILASCCLGRRLMVWDLSRFIMLMLSVTICTRSHACCCRTRFDLYNERSRERMKIRAQHVG